MAPAQAADDAKVEVVAIDDAVLGHEELKCGYDNGRYLIENVERILSETSELTFLDLLQCHARSAGLIFEKRVAVAPLLGEEMVFRVVDVGEHRNERKKWVG